MNNSFIYCISLLLVNLVDWINKCIKGSINSSLAASSLFSNKSDISFILFIKASLVIWLASKYLSKIYKIANDYVSLDCGSCILLYPLFLDWVILFVSWFSILLFSSFSLLYYISSWLSFTFILLSICGSSFLSSFI